MVKDNNNDRTPIKCSFCGKSQSQVKKLVAGPGVYICNECVELCNEIVGEDFVDVPEEDLGKLPKPQEIKATLDEYVIGQERAKEQSIL